MANGDNTANADRRDCLPALCFIPVFAISSWAAASAYFNKRNSGNAANETIWPYLLVAIAITLFGLGIIACNIRNLFLYCSERPGASNAPAAIASTGQSAVQHPVTILQRGALQNGREPISATTTDRSPTLGPTTAVTMPAHVPTLDIPRLEDHEAEELSDSSVVEIDNPTEDGRDGKRDSPTP